MISLLFKANDLFILIPRNGEQALLALDTDSFVLRCTACSYPVTDLAQEWGIDDFPGSNAKWLAQFYAAPAPPALGNANDPRLQDGEFYWIALQPASPTGEPIAVLCAADHKNCFWAVAPDDIETTQLIAEFQAADHDVWIPIRLIDSFEFNNPENGDQPETLAHLAARGATFAGWTIATIDPVAM